MISAFRLRSQGRQPPAGLTLQLPEGELQVEQWLRVLPRKRLVARARLNGCYVLAKLFIAQSAERHWQREADGLRALREGGLPTPKVIAEGRHEGGLYYLISEFLEGSRTLQQRWEELHKPDPGNPQAMQLLRLALRSVAALHRQGLAQQDLHLGNFLLHGEQLYLIDGDALDSLSPGQPLSASQAEDNLAIFFAQLSPAWDALIELLLVDYLQLNSERALNPDRLLQQVARARQRRLRDWLGKALRDCSAFAVQRRFWRFSSVVRGQRDALAGLLANPDSAFAGAPSLKDGGSSSVTRVELGGRELVVKRYNIKGPGHWLRRCLRPSRAWHSWLAAQRLQFLGIATPAPLAMIESRFGPLRRRAWLITEYCPGEDLLTLFGREGDRLPPEPQRQALLQLLQQLAEARISHGDFKATNLLWHDGRVWLIDLDALQVHGSGQAWEKAWSEDCARLARNWPPGSPLRTWLDKALDQH